jgi:hypothetical protein
MMSRRMIMKNATQKIIAGVFIAILFGSCNNFFHELIPPDGDRIISFQVSGQVETEVINDGSIRVTVSQGAKIDALLPVISVSQGANVIPITFDYVQAAFPTAEIFKEASGMYMTSDLTAYVTDLIRRNPDFKIPAIDIPIDFTSPVNFFVISGRGNIRQYTVNVIEETNEPRLLGLSFSKYDNPELVKDALCIIDQGTHSIYAMAT